MKRDSSPPLLAALTAGLFAAAAGLLRLGEAHVQRTGTLHLF